MSLAGGCDPYFTGPWQLWLPVGLTVRPAPGLPRPTFFATSFPRATKSLTATGFGGAGALRVLPPLPETWLPTVRPMCAGYVGCTFLRLGLPDLIGVFTWFFW